MSQKVSRNGVCPCGSGKKFKLCCLRTRSDNRLPQAPLARLNGTGPISFVPRQPYPRPAVTPPTEQREWHEVQAILEMPSGEAFVAVMVYSRKWLRTKNVKVGSPIPFNIPKYRLRGEGRVQAIRPSQTTPQGEGQVLSIDHLGKPDVQSLPPVDQRNWQQVHVRLEESGGTRVYAVLLHSREWLNLQGIQNGGEFPLNLPQQEVQGKGRITLIEPSPIKSDGEGRVMTFVRSNREVEDAPDPLSRPGVRTYFGERLPPVGHEWLPLVLSQAGGLTADVRLIRPRPWMDANWDRLKELENDNARATEVAQWRMVHLSVSVQDGQRVHIALFWQSREVDAYRLTVGEPVLLRLPQEEVSGEGTLTAIDPAPFVPEPGMPQGMLCLTGKQGGSCKGFIEKTEVGDYVVTYTQEERGDRLPIDNTQGKWVARQRIRLHLDKEDGGHSKIVFLRDTKWVRSEHAVVGGTVHLNMPDMGCVGEARVEEVEPCMVFLRWGNSTIRMVTGTFAHSAGVCGDLKFKGESAPLGVTAKHPIWSEDRMDWIPAGELRPGETVKTLKGTTTVESYTMCDKPEPVYNMEVEGDHCYRVGEQGILAHNSSDPCEGVTEGFANAKWDAPYATLYLRRPVGMGGQAGVADPSLPEPRSKPILLPLTKSVTVRLDAIAKGSDASDIVKDLLWRTLWIVYPDNTNDLTTTKPTDATPARIGYNDSSKTDTSGHIIPKQFGGVGTLANVRNFFPQSDSSQNDYNDLWGSESMPLGYTQQKGPAAGQPTIFAVVKGGCGVCVRIELKYPGGAQFPFTESGSRPYRASEIKVEWWTYDKSGHNPQTSRTFTNS